MELSDTCSVTTDMDLIFDENHEGSLPTTAFSSASENITQIKINKYQGLDNFFKKVIDEEKKKHEVVNVNNDTKGPDWKKKFPIPLKNFFGAIFHEKQNAGIQPQLEPLITKEKSGELEKNTNLMDSKIKTDDLLQSKRNFNKKFPPKKLKHTQSTPNFAPIIHHDHYEDEIELLRPQFTHRLTMLKPTSPLNDLSFEDEKEDKPMKKLLTRELSFKNLEAKERLCFLEDLRQNGIEAPKEQVLNNIKKVLENELMKNKEEEKGIGKGNAPWGGDWDKKVVEFQKNSVYGHFPSYQVRNIIIKGGDDLRQELIAMQLIIKFKQIFDDAGLKLFIRPYDIMVTSPDSGILGIFINKICLYI